MIVVDIETSGLDFDKCGIWQIGALDLDNPENVFLEDARIDSEDRVEEGALRITGKTEPELRDSNKQSQRELLESFFKWADNIRIRNCICQNPQFDLGFLKSKSNKYDLRWLFYHRAFDMHSIAQLKYFQLKNEFFINENKSFMDLRNVLMLAGMEDNRGAHNALEDAKLTAECFSRIVFGNGLLEEFKDSDIPDYLKNKEKNDNL